MCVCCQLYNSHGTYCKHFQPRGSVAEQGIQTKETRKRGREKQKAGNATLIVSPRDGPNSASRNKPIWRHQNKFFHTLHVRELHGIVLAIAQREVPGAFPFIPASVLPNIQTLFLPISIDFPCLELPRQFSRARAVDFNPLVDPKAFDC